MLYRPNLLCRALPTTLNRAIDVGCTPSIITASERYVRILSEPFLLLLLTTTTPHEDSGTRSLSRFPLFCRSDGFVILSLLPAGYGKSEKVHIRPRISLYDRDPCIVECGPCFVAYIYMYSPLPLPCPPKCTSSLLKKS
jgi:hypothetical protein